MITYESFGCLRLAMFLKRGTEIEQRDNWEFMGRIWTGDGYGFTEFLRLCNEADVTRSVAVDFIELTRGEAGAIMSAIGLPLAFGMDLNAICAALHATQIDTQQFCADRKSFHFVVGDTEQYYVDCTLINERGLAYAVIMREDYSAAQPELWSPKINRGA